MILALGALAVYIADTLGGGGDTLANAVEVPNLIEQTEADARTILTDLGLVADVVFEDNAEVEPGIVFAQDPAAGGQVEAGGSVETHGVEGSRVDLPAQCRGIERGRGNGHPPGR